MGRKLSHAKGKELQQTQALNKAANRSVSCPVELHGRNVPNGSRYEDTLYHSAVKGLCWKPKICECSIMTPKSLSRSPPSSNELLIQAIDFINQYYKSFKSSKIDEHLARVNEVAQEIDATGSYQLTTEELVFGAKQAWRNAPRCIGRIQWSNLQVFDGRKCSTAKDMFQFLCAHLKFATNAGNIRSAITIFRQRTEGQHDFRVWNGQLIRYAGYQTEDGRTIGDPANVEFTEICVRLGWTPKYGSFDVLPLILQANGEHPELYEIPAELILEVEIEHPHYEWFKGLDLRWYAVPAVSNMLLEIGGLEFTACPFNGWYMGTEIGVRDFCDTQRYNILEKVGRCMGLDTHKLSSLWKDEALVAVNVAKKQVTITDHHSAAESFMKHMETELRLRGGCPADWVWLVPPMSGSLTPVFHQEMISYILSPFYYYQPDPWLTHVWKDEKKGLKKPRRISFKALIRAAVFSQILMKSALVKRVPCTIIYATETGKSQTFAKKLQSILSRAFNPRVLCMEDYNFLDVERECLLMVVTSTFGNGDSPGNGQMFKKYLFSTTSLKNQLRYGVFGLGSRMYPQFCAFARAVDHKLGQLGAKRVTPIGEGDELDGQEESFSIWACTVFKAACEEFGIESHDVWAERLTDSWDPLRHRVQTDSASFELMMGNSPELVIGILKHIPNAPPTNQIVQLEYLPASGQGIAKWKRDTRIPACPLAKALTYLLDISTPPSQSFLHKLSHMTKQKDDRQRLLALAKDFKCYSEWKVFGSPNFLEVLEEFPSLELSAAFLLSQLPVLKPRLYSVSSSPNLHPHELHLTVSVVNYRTQDGKGPLHHGVCSTWLNTLKEGQLVPCFIHRSTGFRLPSDPSSPTILIGAGSGIAPFRSFWQQRFHDMKVSGLKASPMMLVFGCHGADTDHLYKDETLYMKENGTLKSITPAYSRQTGLPKVYVQDVLRKQLSAEVWQVFYQSSGHLYVCGSMNMARDVAHTIQEILVKHLGITLAQAGEHLDQLKAEKRYHEDIFGD